MKTLKYSLIIILITTFYSCERIFEGDTTHVYGKITDIETKDPINNVKIELYEVSSSTLFNNGSSRIADSIFTDENGEYNLEFKQNEKYGYSIKPIAPYYVYYIERNGLLIGGGESLWEGRLQKQNFELSHYGNSILEGIVTDVENEIPLGNVKISVYDYDKPNDILVETTSDNNGNYQISFLQEYYYNDGVIAEYSMFLTLEGYKRKNYGTIFKPDFTKTQNLRMEKIK